MYIIIPLIIPFVFKPHLMRKILLLSILLFPFFSEAKNVWAFLTYSTFNSPEGPYIETYLTVAGNSVKYIKKGKRKIPGNRKCTDDL